jgi:phosphopantothenoylcysteine synthetase/decarboxylase
MKIVIGVTSSISVYKACDLVRLFVKDNFDVHVVMSENATSLVSPLTFETLSGNFVYTKMYAENLREMGHIKLKDNALLFVIAPATANILGKIANGIADDLLSTTFLSMPCPVAVAPAMNPAMWTNPAVAHNVSVLKERGVTVIEPDSGTVACGDEGRGKLAKVETIFNECKKLI